MVLICNISTSKGIAVLERLSNNDNNVYVKYYYKKSGKLITEVNNKNKILINLLLIKVKKEVKKRNLILWSY